MKTSRKIKIIKIPTAEVNSYNLDFKGIDIRVFIGKYFLK